MTKKEFIELLGNKEVLVEAGYLNMVEEILECDYESIKEELASVIHNVKSEEDLKGAADAIETIYEDLKLNMKYIYPNGLGEDSVLPTEGIVREEIKTRSFQRWINKVGVKEFTSLEEVYRLSEDFSLEKHLMSSASGDYEFRLTKGEFNLYITEEEWDKLLLDGEFEYITVEVLYLTQDEKSYIERRVINGEETLYYVAEKGGILKSLKTAYINESIREQLEEKAEKKEKKVESKTKKVAVTKKKPAEGTTGKSKVASPEISQDIITELDDLEI